MNLSRAMVHAACVLIVCTGPMCSGQDHHSDERLTAQAHHEYTAKRFAEAERDFRELAKRDPSNIDTQVLLGQTLFRQEKYVLAAACYENALNLEKRGTRLSLDQHRILVDQLAMAYGISGDLEKVRRLLEGAVRQDPEYPLNYYNLACAFAEEGDKNKALANLSLAFQHKDKVLKGEKMPDPRADSSFRKYLRDDDFIKLMKKIAYE